MNIIPIVKFALGKKSILQHSLTKTGSLQVKWDGYVREWSLVNSGWYNLNKDGRKKESFYNCNYADNIHYQDSEGISYHPLVLIKDEEMAALFWNKCACRPYMEIVPTDLDTAIKMVWTFNIKQNITPEWLTGDNILIY